MRPTRLQAAAAAALILFFAGRSVPRVLFYDVHPGILFWMYPGLEKEAILTCLGKMADMIQQKQTKDPDGLFPQTFDPPECASRDMRKFRVAYWRGGMTGSAFLLFAYRSPQDYYFYTSAEPDVVAQDFSDALSQAGVSGALKFDPTTPDTPDGYYFGDYSKFNRDVVHPPADGSGG